MTIFDTCCKRVKTGIANVFERYGRLVGRHPVPFVILPIVIFGGLGVGLVAIDEETDIESVYYPTDSRGLKDRQYIRDTFPNLNNQSYNPFSQSDVEPFVDLIFKTKQGQSVFNISVMAEISTIVTGVKSLSSSGQTYGDICAVSSSQCVVDGDFVITSAFQAAVSGLAVTFPIWNNIDLQTSISGETVSGGKLISATMLKVSFKMAENNKKWTSQFLRYAEGLEPNLSEVSYATPDSFDEEVDKSTSGDIFLFPLTIVLCFIYASLVTTGGNPVSTRSMLAIGGILAAGLGIVGSMGLLCICRVKFVNLVGVVPFLIIGIGVDDMFLIMSSWSENLPDHPAEQTVSNVPQIVGKALASAGISITITSLTNFLAFAIGATSVFRGVTYFSLYAGVGVLFCYLANVTLFSACLAFHGRRVYSSRHCCTCLESKPRENLLHEGRSTCFAALCGGSPPEKERDDESLCEKFPSKILPSLFKNKAVSIVIILLFAAYLSAAIYGSTKLKQGLVLKDLILDKSYFYTYLSLTDEFFPFRMPVGFVVNQKLDYGGSDSSVFLNLLQQAREDAGIDNSFERCWLTSYMNSTDYDASAPQSFVTNLQTFLTSHADFRADVVLDSSTSQVVASRCFVISVANNDQPSNADLMERMRELADNSPLPVFAYHASFLTLEQFLAVLPATLLLVGCAVVVMTVITFLFLPHLLMLLLLVLTIFMILAGIFGFMHFWGLTLSSLTMIHLVMSVGFSVDFSTHVLAAYLMSDSATRQGRARDAIRHAGGPILNGAMSTMLGVLLLLASSSFIFQSFFKVMFLVIFFGLLHAVFFLPAVLSLLGPNNKVDVVTKDEYHGNDPKSGAKPVSSNTSSKPRIIVVRPKFVNEFKMQHNIYGRHGKNGHIVAKPHMIVV